ncbi:MAG: hypothetical protein GY851_35480 [bacterium]|nr:hypothetical protein [bacterium]
MRPPEKCEECGADLLTAEDYGWAKDRPVCVACSEAMDLVGIACRQESIDIQAVTAPKAWLAQEQE